MSARSISDVRQISLSSSASSHPPAGVVPGPPNGPSNSQHGIYVQRHPISSRHPVAGNALHPINVDSSPSKSLRGGLPPPPPPTVSLAASAALGRSVSPAQVAASLSLRPSYPGGFGALPMPSTAAPNHRGGSAPTSADLRYVQQQYQAAAASQASREHHSGANVYVRNTADRIPSTVSDIRGLPTASSSAAVASISASGRAPLPAAPSAQGYRPLRDVNVMSATGMMTPEMLRWGGAVAAAAAAAAVPNSQQDIQPMPKRPRMDMGHHQSSQGPPPAMAPLRIDTGDNKDSGYHPQVEAISPTGPEAGDDREDLRHEQKDSLLQKITKVDRDIAKAESRIAKLKKKQQELEENAQKGLSDVNEEEEKPRNQSIAQVIYAENRKKARASHAMLEKFNPVCETFGPGCELPLYNQPSDMTLYYTNKQNHALFKPLLVERFKRRIDVKETRERYMTETYTMMLSQWQKKVEKSENSKRRKEREAKSRELYEKIFPELRKQREDKERDHRLGTRGTVRSEAEVEDVIERIQEQELEDKKMHSYAVIPPLLLPPDERKRKFENNNGLILDPLREYEERKFVNTWTDSEKEIFKEKFLLHPKNFGQIAQFLDRKTVSECVQYYYLSKKTENYKQLLRKSTKIRRRGRGGQSAAAAQAAAAAGGSSQDVLGSGVGVTTRTRTQNRQDQDKNNDNHQTEEGNSNRSTPSLKQEIKQEFKEEPKDEEDKKPGKSRGNDSSDEDDGPQQVKSGPHPCNVCKATVDQSRPVTGKGLAILLGLKEDEHGSDYRVCNGCYTKAQRKKHCPLPTCTSTKGRGKGRLRHMPGKWLDLSKDNKELIINELQIPDGTKKCCSACFTKITRKISQLLGGNNSTESHKSATSNDISSDDTNWQDDEIDNFKTALKNHGKSWTAISEALGNKKTPDQCKNFFFNHRKKQQLDKILLELKRQRGDPPTLSTDEESGSSTSSCDEDGGLAQNSATSSGRNSPASARRNNDAAKAKLEATQIKTEIKPEIKTEVKSEVETTPQATSSLQPAGTGRSQLQNSVGEDEEYDSSATMSADEGVDGQPRSSMVTLTTPGGLTIVPGGSGSRPPVMYQGQQSQPRLGFPPDPRLRAPYASNTAMRPPTSIPPVSILPRQVAPNSAQQGYESVITVNELVNDVIEKTLAERPMSGNGPTVSTAGGGQVSSSRNGSPPNAPNPTIQNLLENSVQPPHKNYVRDKVGLNPNQALARPPSHVMAAVISAASAGAQQQQRQAMAPPASRAYPTQPAAASSNDCETLDLSMPRRRDASPPPPPPQSHASSAPQQYREPGHRHPRSSPANSYSNQREAPPPAHSSNKVSTNPDLLIRGDSRQIPSPAGSYSSADGRHMTTSPHHLNRGQSPGLRSTGSLPPGGRVAYTGGVPRHPLPPPASPHIPKGPHPSVSPKLSGKLDRGALSVQTGSITQGTPARLYHENLLKVDGKAPAGSITLGTPLYDKKAPLPQDVRERAATVDFYRRSPSASPYYPSTTSAGTSRPSSYGGGSDLHLASRQVIINDYAMARSNEMQRRPDSREYARGVPLPPGGQISPRGARDPSPRPRPVMGNDLRGGPQLDVRRANDPRYEVRVDPRMIGEHVKVLDHPQHRTDPRATLHDLARGGDPRMDPRGDPRAGLDIRPDPRSALDHRSDPRADLRMAGHPDLRRDSRMVERGDSRIIVDPRAVDPRTGNLIGSDPRLDIDRRPGYYPPQQQQVYLSSDGKYVTGRPRSPPRNTPPPMSRSSIVSTASLQQRPGLMSGKPIVTKPSMAAPSTISHREVEIYRTPSHPEVTISKTNSPRQQHGAYNDQNNPLDSLVNVAIQQPKLPDLKVEQARLGGPQHQSASIHYPGQPRAAHGYEQRGRYETVLDLEKGHPRSSSSGDYRGSHDANQLVQQVHAERSKQQYFILQGDRAVQQSSAARLATPAERAKAAVIAQLPRPTTAASMTLTSGPTRDSAAVIVNDRSAAPVPSSSQSSSLSVARISSEGSSSKTLSSLIDAIVTQRCQAGETSSQPQGCPVPQNAAALSATVSAAPKNMSQFSRKSPGVINLTSEEKSAPYKGGTSRSPSVKSDVANGPEDGAHTASRPGSRSSSVPGPEQAAPSSRPPNVNDPIEPPINKNLQIHATSAPPTSVPQSSSSEYWNRSRGFNGGGDLARVVTTSSITPTSAPTTAASVASIATDERQITRVSQAQTTPTKTGPRMESISPPDGRRMPASEGKNLSPFDYVKNKIAEEMKKGEGALKRPTTDTPADESPRKKPRDEDLPPPDSPGSPGEMVIDESARPDSVSSHASPAPAPTMASQTTSSPSLTITTTTSSGAANPPPETSSPPAPPSSSAPASTTAPKPSAPSTQAPSTAPRYEPLSDDE